MIITTYRMQRYRYTPKPTTIVHFGREDRSEAIWTDQLPQGPINAAILSYRKRLQECIRVAASGHFEHAV